MIFRLNTDFRDSDQTNISYHRGGMDEKCELHHEF